MTMKEDKEHSIEQEVTRDCPILFQMRQRSMSETCMCWGFECGEGWHLIIADGSRELEVLNDYFYPKFRVRIQADQIKEKFGTLCYYYSVVVDPNAFITKLIHICEDIGHWLNDYKRFDYKCKKVTDVEAFDYDDTKELTKEQYDKFVSEKYKPINVEYVVKDGKYFEICHLRNYGKQHFEPTKHKIAWFFKEKINEFRIFLSCFPRKDNAHVRNAINVLNTKASEIVSRMEKECENTCEFCGNQIGTSWSPTCQTTVYIRYICDKCALKLDRDYIKNGALWHGNKMIKTKKALEKHRKELEKKYKESMKELEESI